MGDDSLHEIEAQNPSNYSAIGLDWNATGVSEEFPPTPELVEKQPKPPKPVTKQENSKINKDLEQQSVLANIRNTMDHELKVRKFYA